MRGKMPGFRYWIGVALLAAGCGPQEGEDGTPEGGGPPAEAPAAPAPGPAGPGSAGEFGPTPGPGQCEYRSAARLTGDGIGGLRVGRGVESLESDCVIVSDTIDPRGPEGRPRRLVRVELGPDTVTAEIVEDRIFRLDVESPRIRTVDGLGVGSTIDELLQLQDLRGAAGEGRLFAISPSHCGLSFGLGALPRQRPAGGEWTRAALAELPDTLKVIRVLAFGC